MTKPSYTSPFPFRRTYHALVREQQRSIFRSMIDLLIDLGEPVPAHGNALMYRFNRSTWSEASEILGQDAPAYAKFRNVYAITSQDGAIITVGWLH